MELKRKRANKKTAASYPTYTTARSKRRDFLKLLGKGLLAIPLAGVVNACGVGREMEDEDVWQTAGVAPPPDQSGDVVEEDWVSPGGVGLDIKDNDYQLGGVAPQDIEQIDIGGIAPADIEEEFPPLMGDMPAPDVISKPDTCTTDVEDDYGIPGGIGEPDAGHPQADVKGEVDAEEWPIDGDMAWPEE
jgi:hypothetical protein